MTRKPIVLLLFVLLLTLSACGPGATSTTAPPPTAAPTETVPPTVAPTEPPATEEPGPVSLPPEPQNIHFQAADGQALEGIYYPALANPAPLVVLMHWAPGDQYDWVEIAYWLQNRGLGGQSANPEGGG